MKSKTAKKRITKHENDFSWLPIDSRLLPHLFSFGHVKGIARVFIEIEMILSVFVVLGTFLVVLMKISGVYNR
ncbi:hypothetical protein HY947_05225 [Candidatus Gottesmanbacteria bacterium]|nr:hypothetical protein [Candidatus Gottesmanbacteria bacterium]